MTNQQYTEKDMEEQIKALPPVIRDYVGSDHFKDVMRAVTKTFELHIDKAGALYDETVLILIGLEKGEDFVRNLHSKLDVDENTAVSIAATINQEIFEPLRQEVLNPHTEADDEEEESVLDQHTPSAPPVNIPIRSKGEEIKKDSVAESVKPAEMQESTVAPSSEVDNRMTESTHIPRTEEAEDETKEEDQKKEAPSYGGADPYREPIDEN